MSISALLLLASVVASSETGTIFGTVTNDIDCSAMAGAVVTLWEPTTDTAVVDSLGVFSLRIAPGRHLVKVSYRDYLAATRVVAIDPGRRMRVDFRIHPKPFEMPAVKVEDTKPITKPQYRPPYRMPRPKERFSTARAVRLALEMDAQRRREDLRWLLAARGAVTSDGGFIVPRPPLLRRTDHYYLDPQDIADFGWDHTLGKGPGVVVRW